MRSRLACAGALAAAALAAQCLAAPPSGPSHADLARLHAPFYRFNAWTPSSPPTSTSSSLRG